MNRIHARWMAAILLIGLAMLWTAGCDSEQPSESLPSTLQPRAAEVRPDDPLATAAAQATAIVQHAQATAVVLKAQSEATALVQQAAANGASAVVSEVAEPTASASERPTGPTADQTSESDASSPSPTIVAQDTAAWEDSIEVLGVGFGGDGGYIHVRFMAPPGLAKRWQQGFVKVIDEDTGLEYVEIPVVPVLGVLFGKPVREGQPGYVMLVNGPTPLQPGATVTVVLGNYIEEGIIVQG